MSGGSESPRSAVDGSGDHGKPLVSVLIPAWMAGRTIERALRSVLDEQEIPLECIVVDDGSTDDTAEVVGAVAARDARVILLTMPANEGPSAARNRGLETVRGEWLTFLDADDRLLPGAIAALVRPTSTSDALAVVGQRVWSDGVTTWTARLYRRPDIQEPGRKSLVRNPGLMFYASGTGKLFHRSTFEGLRFDGRVLGDQPWTLRALLRAGDRIEVIGDTVYEWTRPGPGREFVSITSAKRESAAVAARAVDVAVGALQQVIDEAARQLPDPADRRVIAGGYFERLVRADFSGPVTRALESRDPDTPVLFDAITGFLDAAPAEVVIGSGAVVERVLRPPLAGWRLMTGASRQAYWRMYRAASREGRSVNGRRRWGPLRRLGLWVAAGDRRAGRRSAASAALLAASLAWAVARPIVRR